MKRAEWLELIARAYLAAPEYSEAETLLEEALVEAGRLCEIDVDPIVERLTGHIEAVGLGTCDRDQHVNCGCVLSTPTAGGSPA